MTNTRSLVHELEKLFLDFNISSLNGHFVIRDGRIRVEYADVSMEQKDGYFLYAHAAEIAVAETHSRDSLSPELLPELLKELLKELLEYPHTVMLLPKGTIIEIVQRAQERDSLLEEQKFVGSMIEELEAEVKRLRAEVEKGGIADAAWNDAIDAAEIAIIKAPPALKTTNGPVEYFMGKGVAVDAVRSLRKASR